MHGPRWGSPEEELLREHRALIDQAFRLGHENYLLRWLLAEARGERPDERVLAHREPQPSAPTAPERTETPCPVS